MVFFTKSKIFIILISFVFSIALLSWITMPKEKPRKDISVGDPVVDMIFKRACYDCHSTQTIWPWYSKIFPVSVWIQHHQEEGMEEWNLEEWNQLSPEKKRKLSIEIIEEIEENEMPLFSYRLVHKDAIISDQDLDNLKAWAGRYE